MVKYYPDSELKIPDNNHKLAGAGWNHAITTNYYRNAGTRQATSTKPCIWNRHMY